jgi:ppGpp synthetase/RelA/SpoT-type nucleotidyltranferase
MTAIIDAYIARYAREVDYYQEAARLAAICCQALLRRNGMRGIVTHRAKGPERLRDKLIKRGQERKAAKKRGFKTPEDIQADIIDLSGVRIALYFPADRVRVAKLLEDEFEVLKTKHFPEKGKARPGKRFDGYHATHFHVTLRGGNVASPGDRYLSALIEIQVASVLMHAWSEVEHDMIYKPLSGELSEDELAILDELNGMVLAGEIALERLQRAVETRVAEENAKFSNRYELAAFLADETRALRSGKDAELTMGDVGTLLQLLRAAELDQPNRLTPYLQTVREVTESRPIADQLADMVLSEKPHLYTFYAGAKSRISSIGRSVAPKGERMLGEFLARWLVLERFIQILAGERVGKTRERILVPNRKLLEILIGDRELVDRLDWVRMLRNRIVHDYGRISRAEIDEALHAVNTIIEQLQMSNELQIQNAIAEALANS